MIRQMQLEDEKGIDRMEQDKHPPLSLNRVVLTSFRFLFILKVASQG
jgi:hypothetical protein